MPLPANVLDSIGGTRLVQLRYLSTDLFRPVT